MEYRGALTLNELCEDTDHAYDQSCYWGHRVGSHAVYCHNPNSPCGKCRNTWSQGGRDEDCEWFKENNKIERSERMIELRVGQKWVINDDVDNPFNETLAEIVDIERGWVKYSYTSGGGSSRKIGSFIDMYSLKEAPDADKS